MIDTNPPPAQLRPEDTAFFLDVDGTLAEIVADPAQARVAPDVQKVLEALLQRSGGAVALISGRSVEMIDRILSPLKMPAVGVHGLEMRLGDAPSHCAAFDETAHKALVASVTGFAERHDGLRAEPKPGAVALHYRARSDLADDCLRFVQELTRADPHLKLLKGKMVLELIFGTMTKGDAITGLLERAPFAGRRAFYAGDDVTDEAAFDRVNALGGVSVKIGAGDSCARYRLSDPAALIGYIASLVDPADEALEQLRI